MQAVLAAFEAALGKLGPAWITLWNPGASEAQIAAAEAHLGCVFPPELRALYRLHNGQKQGGGLFFDWPFLSLEEMQKEWDSWRDLEGYYQDLFSTDAISVPRGWIREVYTSRGWLPFSKDYGGNALAVDLEPGPQGQRGQVIVCGRDYDIKQVLAPDLASFFQYFVSQIEQGAYDISEDDEVLIELPQTWTPRDPQAANWKTALPAAWQMALKSDSAVFPPNAVPAEMVSLRLLKEEIDSLAPLAAFPELRELIASRTTLRSLEGIQACPHLKKATFGNNRQLADISALTACQELQVLSLYAAPLRDLLPLQGLRALRKLSLDSVPVPDLSPLAELPQLFDLDLRNTPVEALDDLAGLHRLTRLDLANTRVTDLSVLARFSQLRDLGLDGLELSDYSPLVALSHIHTISCGFAQFEILTELLPYRPDITLVGEMTAPQRQQWLDYQRAR